MATHYTEKRACIALLGRALRARGWELFGWHADTSDMMTDYYNPESWSGVATKAGCVVSVGTSEYHVKSHSGKAQTRMIPVAGETCPRCEGAKDDPSGWTLEKARANPQEYHRYEIEIEYPGQKNVRNLFNNVVSPIPFRGNGVRQCLGCHGRGHKMAPPRGELVCTWPVFQANPKGSTWHVEFNGQVIEKGSGLYSSQEDQDKIETIATRIDHAAMNMADAAGPSWVREMKETIAPDVSIAPSSRQGVLVRPSLKRDTYVELVFSDKPDAATRDELKGAGFRWAPSAQCWYGPRASLPKRYEEQHSYLKIAGQS